MSAKTKKTFEVVSIVLLFLAMGLVLYNIMKATDFLIVCYIVLFCALVSAALYFLYGCKKDAAKYFKVFIYLFALSSLLRIAGFAERFTIDRALAASIAFGVASVFSMALDLGKKKSMILGLIALAANLYLFIRMLIAANFIILMRMIMDGDSLISLFESFAYLILACVLNLMLIAKYEDKAERGRR